MADLISGNAAMASVESATSFSSPVRSSADMTRLQALASPPVAVEPHITLLQLRQSTQSRLIF
jgi:hypothetical protein